MDFDIKRFLLALLLCMLVMMLWMKYMYEPPEETTETSPASDSADQTVQTSTAPVPPPDPNASVSDPALWKLQAATSAPQDATLGNREQAEEGYQAQVVIDGASASIASILLNHHKDKVDDEEPGYPLLTTSLDDQDRPIGTLQLNTMKIDGRTKAIDLSRGCWQADSNNTLEKASFTATFQQRIKNQPATVFQVRKTFEYNRDNHELKFYVTLINPTKRPVKIESLELFGPTGIHREDPRGERRMVTAAYADGDGEIELEQESVSLKNEKEQQKTLDKAGGTLRWISVSNKFFATVLRPLPQEKKDTVDYVDTANIKALALEYVDEKEKKRLTPAVQFRVQPTQALPAQGETTFTFQLYLGPISKEVFEQEPFVDLGYNQLIYSGSCSWCAFDWLTNLLLWMMKGIYNLLHNYGVAIIVLVLLVRLILHPISKKSQISMQKMGKIGPKIQELREKCGTDKQEFQRRQMELMKEHGMTGGMLLGCLPMLLQMPIWIALFTAVDSNVAVRHQGLFPASWHWLTDLSAPDRLIPFSWFGLTEPISIPILSTHLRVGGIDAFNLLPILVTIAMYLQMKRSTSQSMTAANPQAQQQQKMMMYMMPAIMLIFFYNAPTGLNLYIMASTFGGLIEQHYIRKHLKEEEAKAAETAVTTTSKVTGKFGPKKKKPKPPRRFY
jgi:YidC/Oxa1 family membrane protein insertase